MASFNRFIRITTFITVASVAVVSAASLDGREDETFALETVAAAAATTEKTLAEAAKPEISPERREELTRTMQALEKTTEDVAKRFPDSPKVQTAAAQQALQARDWARGLQHADAAVAKAEAKGDKAALPDALRARALGAWYMQDFPKAAVDAKRGLELKPGDKALTGIYQLSKGRLRGLEPSTAPPNVPGEREKQLADFLAVSPLDDPRLKAAGERATARTEANKLLDEAMRRLSVGDQRGALTAADAALGQDPFLPDAYFQRALAWNALRDITKALVEVTKAIELWTAQGKTMQAADGYALRAQVRNKGGDRAGALADADSAIELDADKAAGHAERAKALEALGEKAEAVLAGYKRAAELQPRLYTQEYEEAMARYSKDDLGAGVAADSPRWLDRAVLGAVAFLALLVGIVVWLLVRKPKAPESSARESRRLDSQYDLGEVIGEGGMGAVYKGFDRVLKRPVAVKRLRSELQNNPRERERFLKEAEMVASLHHPHIVDIYTIIQDGDQTYLVFEFVAGKTVHDLLNDTPGRRLTPARALELLKQIGEAVDHAHGRHVIHRDLKPSNVMLADGGWVKVMDFGIARQVKDSLLVTTNTIVGTPTYMAPEQAMGQVVKESDVFALACTLYEMLTGAVPYHGAGELQDKLDGRFVAASTLVPDLGTALDPVIRKALDPRPEKRYGSAAAFYKAAAAALSGKATPVG